MIQYIIYKFLHLFVANHNENKIVSLLNKNNQLINNKKNKSYIVFDVGCLRGDFTTYLIKSFKINKINNATFHLFDVNPRSKTYLKHLLKYTNIKFNLLALSDNKGKQEFNFNNFFESSGSSLDTIYMNDNDWVRSRKLIIQLFSLFRIKKDFIKIIVKTDTLVNYCHKNNIDKIDILKIDVDGSEKKVLTGGDKILSNVKIIYTEITESKEKYYLKERNIADYLGNKNFVYFRKDRIKNVSRFSNLICTDNIFLNKKYFNNIENKK